MMQHQVLKGLLIASHLLLAAKAIEIDGKLDFGGSHSSSSSLRSEYRDSKNTFTPVKYSKTIKTSDDFEDIGVVCTSGGCNRTETSSSKTSGDSVQTDVLVHIQTKVDFNQNKSDTAGETPDIPIVVGYGGSQLDATVDDDDSRSLGPQSIFVADTPQVPTYTSVSNIDTIFKPSGSLTPSVGSRVGYGGGNYDGIIYSNNPSQSPSITSRIDSFGNSFHSTNPSTRTGSGFYITRPSPVGSRVDYINRSFDRLDPAAKSGYYPVRHDPGENINIKPISPVSIGASEGDKENGIGIKIPYFDQSYHSHYYGENPPPQFVWNSKKTSGFNPVEFKTVKSSWMPSMWNRNIVPHRHSTILGDGGVKCSCKEESNRPRTGLSWYPNTDTRIPSINDPGSQINDKLAPLN